MQIRSKIIITLLSLCSASSRMSALDNYVSSDTQKLVKKGFVYTGLAGGCGVVAYHTYKFAFGKDERDEKRKAAILRASINEQVKAELDNAIASKTLVTQSDIADGRKAAQDVQVLREELERVKKEMAGKVDSAAGDIAGKAKQLFAPEIATFDGRLNKLDLASKQLAKSEDLTSKTEELRKNLEKLADTIKVKEQNLDGGIKQLAERVAKLEAKPDTSSDKKDGAAL